MTGRIYSEQPGGLEVVDCTHFDCWFLDSAEAAEYTDPQTEGLERFDKASLEAKVHVLINVLSSWEARAGRCLLDMDGFDGTLELVSAVGWDNTIKLIVYGLVEAGFGVYVGDNFIEIYSNQPGNDMGVPRYSQRDMESAVEIAYTAGHYGFKTPNSRDMMSDFIDWAVTFEKTPYEDDDWMELIDSFAIEKLAIEVERGQAHLELGHRTGLPLIQSHQHLDKWLTLRDDTWIYLPSHGDHIFTKGDFVKLCEGNIERAFQLYRMCKWQHPAMIISNSGGLEQLFSQNLSAV